MNYFIAIRVLHLEKRLAVLNGEPRHHRSRPEHITVPRDVVAEDLGEDPPVFQPPVQRLMTRPHPPLHCPILCRIRTVAGAFDFVRVSVVPLVGLDPLARLEEVPQNFVENFNVSILTGRVRPLDPHQVPCEDVHSQLVAQGRLPRVLVGTEGVPLLRGSLLGNAEVRAVDCHRAVIEHVVRTQSALEVDLRLRGRQRGRVRTRCWEKKSYA